MKIKKRVLNDALRVLGKVVCQTSPVELYRSIRFVGDERSIRAMATDGMVVVEVAVDAVTNLEVDFCLPFKELKELVRISRSNELKVTGKFIAFPEMEPPPSDVISAVLPANFWELIAQAAPIIDRSNPRRVLQGYTTFKTHSDGMIPVIASGGDGQYIAMPIRTIKTNPNYKEEEKMNIQENKVVSAHIEQSAAPQNNDTAVNPLDELGAAVEEFKLKIKAMFDESAVLSRKVKEVALIQKQKERDFIQARRAIERIRMAI